MGCRRNLVAALLVGATITVASDAYAQGSGGFWFGLGVGAGWQLDEPPAGLTNVGGAFSLKFGGTPKRWLRIGGEALVWGSSSEGIGNSNAIPG